MNIYALDHVQLAIPRGGEETARGFYVGVLGMKEIEKPGSLRERGGCWFGAGTLQLHLGVEDDFRAARKAHPALLVEDLAAIVAACEQAGIPATADRMLEGYDRAYVHDPFGNRLELMQKK